MSAEHGLCFCYRHGYLSRTQSATAPSTKAPEGAHQILDVDADGQEESVKLADGLSSWRATSASSTPSNAIGNATNSTPPATSARGADEAPAVTGRYHDTRPTSASATMGAPSNSTAVSSRILARPATTFTRSTERGTSSAAPEDPENPEEHQRVRQGQEGGNRQCYPNRENCNRNSHRSVTLRCRSKLARSFD